jgi:hypothetical protein
MMVQQVQRHPSGPDQGQPTTTEERSTALGRPRQRVEIDLLLGIKNF